DGSGGGGQLNLSGATPNGPRGVDIDHAAGRIYWANRDTHTISYANLDGSGGGGQLDTTGATVNKPHGVTIDPMAGRIYWTNVDSAIFYANLDGSGGGHQLDLSGAGPSGPVGMAIDPSAGLMYMANLGNDAIPFVNLDGSGVGGQLNISGATSSDPRFLTLLRAPRGTGAPAIGGESAIGSVLSCSQGSWAPDLPEAFLYRAPKTFAYQWSRDGTDIVGATTSLYTVFATGEYRCRVTASNEAGPTSQTSAPRAVTGAGGGTGGGAGGGAGAAGAGTTTFPPAPARVRFVLGLRGLLPRPAPGFRVRCARRSFRATLAGTVAQARRVEFLFGQPGRALRRVGSDTRAPFAWLVPRRALGIRGIYAIRAVAIRHDGQRVTLTRTFQAC
ncbi:MAG: hypothetical protein QOI52_48, partial [Chloroflexota bacterium]|nr:hypothetical protein [Chloroflexota bacterium]